MSKTIFHIDLNAFFAKAEQLRNPDLIGKPIVVSGQHRRSVITTASYEARQFKIHSGMPLHQALSLCPNLIIVPVDLAYYRQLSTTFISYLSQYTTLIEQASIDECYLDVTDVATNDQMLDLAFQIQRGLFQQHHLECSIGIASNRFLAKMASDMYKPMGISIIRDNEIETKLWPISIDNMFGIGKKTAPVLKKLGIMTIGDLANYQNISKLSTVLGKNTIHYINNANGIGNDIIELEYDHKSIGQSSTFLDNVTDYDEIIALFTKLATKVSLRLKKANLSTNHITITIRNGQFQTINKSKSLSRYIQNSTEILEEALLLFDHNYNGDPVRLLGISVQNLKEKQDIVTQLNFFDTI